jgi:hypothetical protein
MKTASKLDTGWSTVKTVSNSITRSFVVPLPNPPHFPFSSSAALPNPHHRGRAGGLVVKGAREHPAGGGSNPCPAPTPLKVSNEDWATGASILKKILSPKCAHTCPKRHLNPSITHPVQPVHIFGHFYPIRRVNHLIID